MAFPEGIKRAHVIGAGGIGVSAVAKLLRHHGATVTGSDLSRNEAVEELEQAGIAVAKGHAAANLPADTELVVYSDAVPVENPERQAAAERSIRQLSYFDFLGEYSRGKHTLVVSGTNGKSTTTALLGLILEKAGLDPTVIVGTKVPGWPDRNLRLGHSQYFVVEGCEYRANMLKLAPRTIVLTNIEEDHLDYYRDLAHIRETFQKFVGKLPADGTLILNADDHISFHEIEPKSAFVTYGLDHPADYVGRVHAVGDGRQTFGITRTLGQEHLLGEFTMAVPGIFNVQNALAAAAAAFELGVTPETVRAALAEFRGVWRRFEKVGERHGAPIISDYGHHPSAVKLTLAGARSFYPDRRLVLCFQPHQRNRTRKLFAEFVASFDGADFLVLPEIYDVAGREEAADRDISSRELVKAVLARDSEHGRERPVIYSPDLTAARQELERLLLPNDVALVMGAGDVYNICRSLLSVGKA